MEVWGAAQDVERVSYLTNASVKAVLCVSALSCVWRARNISTTNTDTFIERRWRMFSENSVEATHLFSYWPATTPPEAERTDHVCADFFKAFSEATQNLNKIII